MKDMHINQSAIREDFPSLDEWLGPDILDADGIPRRSSRFDEVLVGMSSVTQDSGRV